MCDGKIVRVSGKWLLMISLAFLLTGCSSSYDYGVDEGSYYGNEDSEDLVTGENWECTGDCSGHEAGYEWASDKGITSPGDCGGKSESFIEGCEAYANEQQMENGSDYGDYDNY